MANALDSGRPDPASATTPTEFVDNLNRLRQWAGQPSLRTLSKLAGPRPGSGEPPVEALPTSTTHEILAGKRLPRLPRLDFVEGFVTACLRAAHRPAADIDHELEDWRSSWRALTGAANGNHQVPASDPAPRAGSGPWPDRLRRRGILVRTALALALFAGGALAGAAATNWLSGGPQSPGTDAQCPQPQAPIPRDGNELVTNGTFDNAIDPWVQFGPLTHLEDRHLRIRVPGGTPKPSDSLVEQREIPLAKGRRYTMTFTIAANRTVTITAAVQKEHHPWHKVIKEEIRGRPTPCTYTFSAVSNIDEPRGVVTFHLGGHAEEVSFTLDEVSLREHG